MNRLNFNKNREKLKHMFGIKNNNCLITKYKCKKLIVVILKKKQFKGKI